MADRIEKYLAYAKACDSLLRTKLTRDEREMIAEMAKKWRTLAESRRTMLSIREKSK